MITALIKRRLWLWKNRLIPSMTFFLLLPILIFSMIGVPLKNVIQYSLSGELFSIWVLPGLIFIISSISLYAPLYREFFDFRIHRKVLVNIALTPHSKSKVVFSNLVTASLEAIIIGILSLFFYITIISAPFSFINFLFLLICLMIYLMLLGNLLISLSLFIDNLSIMTLAMFMIFIVILFGNGFLLEFEFFPLAVESILEYQPLSLPYQSYQMFITTGTLDWLTLGFLTLVIYFWVIFNGYLLKQKLKQ